jgi:aspartyl-tRNA(Asn)/glutamyl-tRNA(Gln) amidotransferase subunit A
LDNRELCYLDIASLGQLYRNGKLSPVEVTQAVLDRIHTLDKRLNAFITVLDEPALKRARQAEVELRAGNDLGPLHGVPVSLKDLIETAGVRTTCASPIRRDEIPAQSATVARRLEEAGAVLIGKCNLLEFAYGIVHPEFGQCNNPWDITRTSGGSSSGSAASIAAGMGYGSLGTDTGGSIRIPASYCGVVGFKPTYGRVSRQGVFPLSWSLDHVGTLTRTVTDSAILLKIIAGQDPLDTTSSPSPVPDYQAVLNGDVRGLRLGILEQHMTGLDLRPGVEDSVRQAISLLEKAGMLIKEIQLPSLDGADPAMLLAILPESTLIHEKWLRQRPQDYAEMTRQQLETGALISAVDYLRAQQYRTLLLRECMQAFQDVDIIVNPTVAWEAPQEDPSLAGGEGATEARRTGPFNLTGLPAISVPCGFGPSGLPLGLQIIGAPFAEETVIRVAFAYEQRAGWLRHHPNLD